MKLTTKALLTFTTAGLLAASAANAATITSQAYELGDLQGTASTSGVFQTAGVLPLSGATPIGGVTTTLVGVANPNNASAPIVYTYQAIHADATFTYDISASMFAFDGSTATQVNDRNNNGELMPDSSLGGEHRQRIDGSDTVGAGKWEFARFTVGNVQVISGGPVNLLGFNSFRVDTAANSLSGDIVPVQQTSSGNVEDVNDSGNVIDSWAGGVLGQNNVIDLSDTYTTAIDLVGVTSAANANTNQPHGFAVDFDVVPEPSSLALLGLGGLLIAARRRRD